MFSVLIDEEARERRVVATGIPTQAEADGCVKATLAELDAAGWQFQNWQSKGDGRSVEILERRGRRAFVLLERED